MQDRFYQAKGRDEMNAAAQTLMQDYAFQTWPRANQKYRIWKLSRLLKWTERRTKALWYCEQGISVRAEEMAALEQLKTQEVKNEYAELRQRIARLEAALAVQDEAFHRPQIDALEQQIRGRGRVDISRNRGE